MNLKIIGSIVIVKFFSSNVKSYNPLITRTLKKIGVLDKKYLNIPKEDEFWKVKILKEICEGQNKGCFILEPLNLVDPKTIIKLVPGMYNQYEKDKVLFVIPKVPNHNYILPLDIKKKLPYRAILVKLN